MTALVDGVAWSSIVTITTRTTLPTEPRGVLGVSGTNAFTGQYIEITFAVPNAVGTYTIGPGQISNGALQIPNNFASWTASTTIGSGTIVVSSLTSTGAAGTFTLTLPPLSNTRATGTKLVTNGQFNVTF